MSSVEQISDDDESFDQIDLSNIQEQAKNQGNIDDIVGISSDEDTIPYLISDDEDLPEVDVKRSAVIKNLFPTKPHLDQFKKGAKNQWRPASVVAVKADVGEHASTSSGFPQEVKLLGHQTPIGGVNVHTPLKPYGCQIALMFKLITAINKSQNCLLESPTGSGKTMALLCAALAWQRQERKKVADLLNKQYYNDHPELNQLDGAVDLADLQQHLSSPEKIFTKNKFGEKSIYDSPVKRADASSKRQEPMQDLDCCDESSRNGEVAIHKKRRVGSPGCDSPACSKTSPQWSKNATPQVTPEKMNNADQPETPQSVRTPTIYYGARTHKQLQQVIKEFGRTNYCGEAKMSILSSRDYSCIREFDRNLWQSKNDMCRGCVKKSLTESQREKPKTETNCVYYNNVKAFTHERLPAAFDLDDLEEAGRDLQACPYYAARSMAAVAHIIFCPYNYLMDPGIRSSMSISLQDNIIIIDEAHNIEDMCRDAATYTITEENVQACIKELEHCTQYRYANQDCLHYLDYLLDTLKKWEQWFVNQRPLVSSRPVVGGEASHVWETEHFLQTLANHCIGHKEFPTFSEAAQTLVNKLGEGTATLYGVTQATGTLIETIHSALGYMYQENGKYKCDFKPLLIRTVISGELAGSKAWRNSQFNKSIEKDTLSLRVLCLNPGVVFAQLSAARCVALASGTLTPLGSLHSELAAAFPHQASPAHVIPAERVWIGTLTTAPDGRPLKCTAAETDLAVTQDALGDTLRWVCGVTPHGVLCFLPSYALMNKLYRRWDETGLWRKLNNLKHVFMESRNTKDHNDIMEEFYSCVCGEKGALLLAVYRGKVSEGMDFKDQQARAVITVGIPYPNTFDVSVREKMSYNDRYGGARGLLPSREWLRVQAYRALNQAVGRCVRHRADWGAVLLVDARFAQPYYTEHLAKWARAFLGNNHNTYESLVNSDDGLEDFMQRMTCSENQNVQK